MIKPAICIELLYQGETAARKIARVAAAGFDCVEFWGWRDKDIKAIKAACDQSNVSVVNFSGQRVGDLVYSASHPLLVDDYKDALKAAEVLEVKTHMFLTNELKPDGHAVNSYDHIPAAEKDSAVVEGLKKIVPLIPDQARIILEPLNTVQDHIGYHLDNMEKAVRLLDRVGDKRVKILCDLYHQGMMGDNLFDLIDAYADYIGYYHVAGVPTRQEPGADTVDWPAVLTAIRQSGYNGYVGFEYAPANDSDASLAGVKALWEGVFGSCGPGSENR